MRRPQSLTEFYYGFVRVTLSWQVLFVLIAGNPARYRSLMLVAVLEKLIYAAFSDDSLLRGQDSAKYILAVAPRSDIRNVVYCSVSAHRESIEQVPKEAFSGATVGRPRGQSISFSLIDQSRFRYYTYFAQGVIPQAIRFTYPSELVSSW